MHAIRCGNRFRFRAPFWVCQYGMGGIKRFSTLVTLPTYFFFLSFQLQKGPTINMSFQDGHVHAIGCGDWILFPVCIFGLVPVCKYGLGKRKDFFRFCLCSPAPCSFFQCSKGTIIDMSIRTRMCIWERAPLMKTTEFSTMVTESLRILTYTIIFISRHFESRSKQPSLPFRPPSTSATMRTGTF